MIKGLTDKPSAFPQIGVLRKGAAKPDRGPGKDLNHFRFDSDDPDAVKAFNDAYGTEPRAIFAYVPFETTDENFEAWKEEWDASSLRHRCDGETMVRWLTPQGTYSTAPKSCTGGCKQVGRLRIIIPELKRMAYVMVQTTSIHDIMEIHQNLQALESARGSLRGIPLVIRRTPREISTPGPDGKRIRREKWLIAVEAQPAWVEQQLRVTAAAAMPSLPGAPALALPSWDGDDDDADDVTPAIAEAQPVAVDPAAAASVEKALKLVAMHQANDNAGKAKVVFDRDYAPLTFDARQQVLIEIKPTLISAVDAICAELDARIGAEALNQLLVVNAGTMAFDDMDSIALVSLLSALKRERQKAPAKAVSA